jgi:hypothetical protein
MVGHRKPKHNMSCMHYGKFAVGQSLTRFMAKRLAEQVAKRLAEQTPQHCNPYVDVAKPTRVGKAVKDELVE